MPGRAVQILNLVEDLHARQEGRLLKLDTEVLKDIVGKAEDHSLAVIVIAGPEGQGKSFILSYFVRYLEALERSATGNAGDWMERGQPNISMKNRGFSFASSLERTTEGIWMWSRPFIIPWTAEPKKKLAVLLMDTEGCYGSSLSNQEQAAIVGLSLLTSSVFIYNEATKINDNTIATVAKFMEYSQLASQSFQGPMFQQIMFLVRDWNRPGIHEYGASGGRSFIQEFLSGNTKMCKEALKNRKAIMEHFEGVSAYLMPHPGDQVLSNQFTGSVAEMKSDFAHHVELFVANLISDVAPKRINNEFISGSQFVTMFDLYVKAFNNSDIPSPASIVKATLFIAFEGEIKGLVQSFEQILKAKIEESGGLMSPQQLTLWSKETAEQTVCSFEEKQHFCPPEDKAIHTERLRSELDRMYRKISEENNHRLQKLIQNASDDTLTQFNKFLTDNILQANRFWKRPEFEGEVRPAEDRCLQYFLSTCQAAPDDFVQSSLREVEDRIQNAKESLWIELSQQRNAAENTASTLMEEVITECVKAVRMLTDEVTHSDVQLEKILQINSNLASSTLRSRLEREFHDGAFIAEWVNQLDALLSAEFENIKEANSMKINAIRVKFENEINEAVRLFKEEATAIMEDLLKADPRAVIDVHRTVWEVALETFREITCPDSTMQMEYVEKLKTDLKAALDEALDYLTNSVEAKRLRCQQIVGSSVDGFERSLGAWIQTNGTVTAVTFDRETQLLLSTAVNICQESLKEVLPEYGTFCIEAQSAMKKLLESAAEKNLQEVSRIEQFFTQQLEIIKGTYRTSIEAQLKANIDLARAHAEVCSKLLEEFREKFRPFNAPTLLESYESTVATQINQILHEKQREVSERLENIKKLRKHIIPHHENEFKSKIKALITENPFISQDEFQSILDDRRRETNNLLMKQISQFFPLHSLQGTGFINEVESQGEYSKKELKRTLHDLRVRAEENVLKVKQQVMAFVRTEISQILEDWKHDEAVKVYEQFDNLQDEAFNKFERSWPYGNCLKKDIMKRKLQDNVEAEIEAAREKILQKMNKESQVVASAMNTFLSSFALPIKNTLDSGKYMRDQKLEKYLDDEIRENLDKFTCLLLSEEVQSGKHSTDLQEKLMEKRLAFIQTNLHNLEMILKKAEELVQQNYAESNKLKTYSEIELLKHRTDAMVTKYLEENCAGGCDQDLKNQAIQKVNHQHDCLLTRIEAEVNGKIQYLVEDAVKYYNRSMEDYLLNIMPVHPSVVTDYHRKSSQYAMKELKGKGCFITTALETAVTKALKLAHKTWVEKNNLKGGEDNNLAIGIDLGTTTCCVSIHRIGETRVLNDRSDRNLTPSFLYFSEDWSAIVGHEAKNQAHIHPEDTVFDAKRLVGRKFKDPDVQKDMKMWPFKVVEDPVTLEPRIIIRGKSFRAEEILAQLLRHMKNIAEEALSEHGNIKKAVITVPAKYSDRMRDATRQAAQIADLEVLQIINEPTAAAMAYAVQWKGPARKVLVFDFGGGTLDVTILRTGEEKEVTPVEDPNNRAPAKVMKKSDAESEETSTHLHVITTKGELHLGGEDFDSNMVRFCAQKFEEQHGIQLLKAENPNAEIKVKRRLRRLRNECEAVKVRLTSAETATANLDTIFNDIDLQVEVTRKDFEDMNAELFQKALDLVEEALKDAQLSKEDIDEVLMVGGSSRIPRMRQLLQQYFDKPALNLNQRIDIQEAVAKGAAIMACIIAGGSNVKGLPKITDIQPLSLGIELVTGEMSVIIPRKTSIPAKHTETYCTIYDNQTEAGILIYSGEDAVAKSENNSRLGQFKLGGIPRDKAGKQAIEVTMEIDASGILNVTAVCVSTGGKKNLPIKSDRIRLSPQEMAELNSKFKSPGE